MSKQYVGLEGDISVPGVVVIRHDGRIAYRQIANTADDRLAAADILAAVDRTLGTHGASAPRGYTALERWQLRLDLGAGHATGKTSPIGTVGGLFPIGRHVVAGPWLRVARSTIDADGAIGVRLPLLDNTTAVQLIATGGATVNAPFQGRATAGLRAGAWYAFRPWWAIQLEAGALAHDLAGSRATEVELTFGISRLFRLR